MKIYPKSEPRQFTVKGVTISHMADIDLDADELVTFRNGQSQSEFDVVAKDWGFYATPSLNGRLREQGFRSVLAKSVENGRRYVLLVREGQEAAFNAYLSQQGMVVLGMLDEDSLQIED